MTSCHAIVLLVKAGSTFVQDQAENHQQVDLTIYQRLVGKLMYLSCGTCPDIAFVVGQLSRYNSDPQVGHHWITKQVLRYLKGSITPCIEWGRDLACHRLGEKYGKFGVIEYVDSSYTGDLNDRKSITGYCFFLGRDIVTWYSKRQCIVSTSTSEAEYVAMSHGAKEGIWIRRLLNELLSE